MALLSSLFGTALGSAARVGSEAIREARQRDALSIEEFKKNVQEKKAAFAKQQAAAQAQTEKINNIATFLKNQPGYEMLNSTELNDLALQLTQMSGDKNPISFYNETIEKGKLDLIPRVSTVTTNVPTGGMKDVGLIDGRPARAQPETKEAVVPVSSLLGKKKNDQAVQTASLLAPYRKQSFLQTALAGRNLGGLQRDALRQLGMSERQYNSMMTQQVRTPANQNTASFIVSKRPDLKPVLDRITKLDGIIFEQAGKDPNFMNPNYKVPLMIPADRDYKIGTGQFVDAGPGGVEKDEVMKTIRKGEPITMEINPFQNYLKAYGQFTTQVLPNPLALKDPKNFKVMLDIQNSTLMQFGNVAKKKEIVNMFDTLYKKNFDIITEEYTKVPVSVRNDINLTQRLEEINASYLQQTELMAAGNYAEAMKVMKETGAKINSVFLDLKPELDVANKRAKYAYINNLISGLENTDGIFARIPEEIMSMYDGLREDFEAGLEDENEDLLKDVYQRAKKIAGSLNEVKSLTMPEKEKEDLAFVESLMLQYKEQFPDKSPEEYAVAREKITADVKKKFANQKIKSDGGVFYRQVFTFTEDENGFVKQSLEAIPTEIGGITLHAGLTADDFKVARASTAKYYGNLINLGRLLRGVQRDGLLFGSMANARMIYGDTADTLRSLENFIFKTDFLGGLQNNAGYLREMNQMVTAFVGAAKDELFDDPRLSDQDLALVINYIGLLNKPGQFNLIGQENALASLIGLEKIFLKQQALNMFITKGREYGDVIRPGDFVGKDINLSKDSIARDLFLQMMRNRGLEPADFMVKGTDADGEMKGKFIGFDDDKIEKYFDDNRNTFGYSKKNKKLRNRAAYFAFDDTIKEIRTSVRYAMESASGFTYGTSNSSAKFRQTSMTPGILHSVTSDGDAVTQTRNLLIEMAIANGEPPNSLIDKLEASGRDILGVSELTLSRYEKD